MQDLTYKINNENIEILKDRTCIATIDCDGLIHVHHTIQPVDRFKIIQLRKDLFQTNQVVLLERQKQLENKWTEESISFLVKDSVCSYFINNQPMFQFNATRELLHLDSSLPLTLRKKWMHALLFEDIDTCVAPLLDQTKYTQAQQESLVEACVGLGYNFNQLLEYIDSKTATPLLPVLVDCVLYQFPSSMIQLITSTYQTHQSTYLCQLVVNELIQDTSLNKIKQALQDISSKQHVDVSSLDRLINYKKQPIHTQSVQFKSVDENRYQILVENKEVGNIDTKTGEVRLNRKVITAEIDDEIQAKIQELQSSLEKGREL